jgi:hypothetical protein
MRQQQDLLAYARQQADQLEKDMTWNENGYWQASDRSMVQTIASRAVAALEFFRQYAGEDSFWTQRAMDVYQNRGENQSLETGARGVGDLLRAWADQVEAGIVEIAGLRAWAEVGIVSTDVMSQVRRLLEDGEAHPAAAIVLCGAALEIALRSVVQARNLTPPARSTLSALTGVLRQADLITVQDVKDLEQCAGLRNLAAHGDFDNLSHERAGLMEQQTNILLRRLADLHN